MAESRATNEQAPSPRSLHTRLNEIWFLLDFPRAPTAAGQRPTYLLNSYNAAAVRALREKMSLASSPPSPPPTPLSSLGSLLRGRTRSRTFVSSLARSLSALQWRRRRRRVRIGGRKEGRKQRAAAFVLSCDGRLLVRLPPASSLARFETQLLWLERGAELETDSRRGRRRRHREHRPKDRASLSFSK